MTTVKFKQSGVMLLLVAGSLAATDKEPVVVKDFNSRIAEYAKLQERLERQLPALPDKATPEQIAHNQKELSKAIQAARAGARQGDVFGPAERHFRQVIAREMSGKAGVSAKRTTKEGNPAQESPVPVPLAVNAVYPSKAPRSTVPPMLLIQLPSLPKEIQYHFVGRHLVIEDIKANLIIDFLRNAIPETRR